MYAPISPYAYVANNPINLIDPNGMEIKGLTKDDAAKFQEDVNTVFSDDKFESFRGLISRNKKGKGKKFNTIDSDALSSALDGVDLSEDEQALVGELVGAINHSEGRICFDEETGGERAEWCLKDHLGNTRVSFADVNGDGNIEVLDDPETEEVYEREVFQENHYYPFGMAREDCSLDTLKENKYLYNGKELDTDFGLNWYHYGARMYDPAVGRFTSIDPLAESFAFQTPYAYAANNPIKYIDKNGENPILGALIGAVTEVGSQVATNYISGNPLLELDLVDIGTAAGAGALSGGLSVLNRVRKTTKVISAIRKNQKAISNVAKGLEETTNAAFDSKLDATTGELKNENVLNGGKNIAAAVLEGTISAGSSIVSDKISGKVAESFNKKAAKEMRFAEVQGNRAQIGSQRKADMRSKVNSLRNDINGNEKVINGIGGLAGDAASERPSQAAQEKVKTIFP